MDFKNKWIDLYDKKREEVLETRRYLEILNPSNTPLPTDLLGEWGKYCTIGWVTEQMKSTCIKDVKERHSWNFTKCCFNTVLTLLTI